MREATRTAPTTGTLHAGPRVLLVFLGGAVGSLLRTMLLLPFSGADNPSEAVILLVINVGGALLLGYVVAAIASPSPRADAGRALLGTGLLGGFTSYSSLVLLASPVGGAWPAGLWLALASLGAGIAAAYLGVRLGDVVHRSAASRSPGASA